MFYTLGYSFENKYSSNFCFSGKLFVGNEIATYFTFKVLIYLRSLSKWMPTSNSNLRPYVILRIELGRNSEERAKESEVIAGGHSGLE